MAVNYAILDELPYVSQEIVPFTDRNLHKKMVKDFEKRLVNIAEYAMAETRYQNSAYLDYRLKGIYQAFNYPPKVSYHVSKPDKRIEL